MGKIISRFRKQPSTLEELERIDKEIESNLRLRRRDGELEKQYVGTLFLYSVIIYLIMALVFYLYFVPENWTGRAIQILPLLLFPIIIWLVRRLIKFYFKKRISKCDMKLSDLRAEKKKILEEVKEKESYKKAKEILDKYDPTSVSPPPAPIIATPPTGRSPQGVTPALRQRLPPSGRGRGRGRATPMIPKGQTPGPRGTPWTTPQMTGQRPMSRPPSTVRPVLQRERGTVDKLVDYLVGDGPGNRYALICRHCYSHNGMALQEEFEYLAFRCPYCGTFNPSRKTRPNAPRLPESGPSSSAEQGVFSGSSGGSESESEDDSNQKPLTALPAPQTDSTGDEEPSDQPHEDAPSQLEADPEAVQEETEQLVEAESNASLHPHDKEESDTSAPIGSDNTTAEQESTPHDSQQPEIS